jgi:CheY-like chemotaxis protein
MTKADQRYPGKGAGNRRPHSHCSHDGHARKEDEDSCLAAGRDAYISKPIDFKQCLQVIKDIMFAQFLSLPLPQKNILFVISKYPQ